MKHVPEHLETTYKLIKSAFPDGIDEEVYLPLIAVIYEEMSDRNIAELFSILMQKDKDIVLNDVYKASSMDLDLEKSRLIEHLDKFGYQDWLKEE